MANLEGSDDWTNVTWTKVKPLTNQNFLEDNLLDTMNPEIPMMTLDPQLAANTFNNTLIQLGKLQGITGIPLAYIVCHILKGSNNADIDNMTKDPSPFGEPGSPYF